MGRPAERWPTYALENLEKTLYELKQLERVLDSAQDAILLGNDAAGDEVTAMHLLAEAKAANQEAVAFAERARAQ